MSASRPNRFSRTSSEGAELFSFEDNDEDYVKVQPPPSERVRHSSTALLIRVVEAGTFGPDWVKLAEEELIRRAKR